MRNAVRGVAAENDLVLVALSGGADSLALAAAAAFELPRAGMRAGAVIVDHQMQPGSAAQAQRAAAQARELGLDPVVIETVDVTDDGAGPEASARAVRYAAIDRVRNELDASWVLLGHTLDDQAETVLLGLARGSGGKSLHGMAVVNDALIRPLLGIRRRETEQACADQGLDAWHDPMNDDERYKRVRIRKNVMPLLESELGPGIAEALARTATTLREDSETLDALALEWAQEIVGTDADGRVTLDVGGLVTQPAALRQRICRAVAEQGFGVSLSRAHTMAVASLATEWRGQGPIDLPGIRVERTAGRLFFGAAGRDEHDDEPDASGSEPEATAAE